MDPVRQLKERRRMILRKPHIVDEYFSRCFKEFFKVYFGSDCLDVVWNWYQIEYQARGTAHVHGCVWLKSDPGCTLLGKKYWMNV